MDDEYIENVIKKGDNASEVMHGICQKTCSFRDEVNVADPATGGLTVVRANPGKKIQFIQQ